MHFFSSLANSCVHRVRIRRAPQARMCSLPHCGVGALAVCGFDCTGACDMKPTAENDNRTHGVKMIRAIWDVPQSA